MSRGELTLVIAKREARRTQLACRGLLDGSAVQMLPEASEELWYHLAELAVGFL